MFLFRTNISICFVAESLELIEKFVDDIQAIRDQFRTMADSWNETTNSITDSDEIYISIQSQFNDNAKNEHYDLALGDELIKKMDARHSTIFKNTMNEYFEKNGRPDFIDVENEVFNDLIDIRNSIDYEIIEFGIIASDLKSINYELPKMKTVDNGSLT